MTIRQYLDKKVEEKMVIDPEVFLTEVNAYLLVGGNIKITRRDIVEYLDSHQDFFSDNNLYRRFVREA